MTGLTAKERAALAYLTELDEFKAFKKLCTLKRQKVADQILAFNMSQPGATEQAAMLQGQYYALEFILKELQSIHKKEIDAAVKEKSKP